MMKNRLIWIIVLTGIAALCGCSRKCCSEISLTPAPPLGWNSFDSYGVYLHEKAAMDNLEAFAEKLKPHGYEYFVIDAGWFGEFELREGTMYSKEKHARKLNVNEFGLLQPSKTYFPNGLKPIIDRCHELGLKFGLHLMRGIPRIAVEKNLPVKGTPYRAADIADTSSICVWCHQNYGVDMSKPGSQEFYNSLINQMAEWGVDFIKYDDIVPYPAEVQAVVNAIRQCGRPIVLSLSPGGKVDKEHLDIFKQANMLRVTNDVWDEQKYIDECFAAWEKWQGVAGNGFWIDMDMIPFGQLQLMSPRPEIITGDESKEELDRVLKEIKKDKSFELLSGKGWTRWCQLSKSQMETFIVMRALSASPLMVGGDLPTIDSVSLSLVTNKDIIECNQNGVMGHLVFSDDALEVWKTPSTTFDGGWMGVFNRSGEEISRIVSEENMELESGKYELYDIFGNSVIDTDIFSISPYGVVFIRYSET